MRFESVSAGRRDPILWQRSVTSNDFREERVTNLLGVNINNQYIVRFEVFTTVNMKNAVFLDVTPCGSCENRRLRNVSPPSSYWKEPWWWRRYVTSKRRVLREPHGVTCQKRALISQYIIIIYIIIYCNNIHTRGARVTQLGWGVMLQAEILWVRFTMMVSDTFQFISASNRNEFQESSWG
jgi:hypothetical protein